MLLMATCLLVIRSSPQRHLIPRKSLMDDRSSFGFRFLRNLRILNSTAGLNSSVRSFCQIIYRDSAPSKGRVLTLASRGIVVVRVLLRGFGCDAEREAEFPQGKEGD